MNTPSTILIISNNSDFSESLVDLLAQEFSANCKIANSEDKLPQECSLIISDQPLKAQYSCPVIIVKLPVRMRDLFAEISAALKASDLIEIGADFTLSLQNKILHGRGDALIDLTDKETQLLQSLADAGAGGISREDLLKEVWKIDTAIDTHTLETHIYRLRKKIRDAFSVELIKAASGGYGL